MTEWPDSLDAVVAAPAHHTVLLENDRVRVLETRIESGDTTPVHTHRRPSVLTFVSFSDVVRRDGDGLLLSDSRGSGDPPQVIWSEPMPPHTVENVGEGLLHLVTVELKGR